jgi:hypothetical protein
MKLLVVCSRAKESLRKREPKRQRKKNEENEEYKRKARNSNNNATPQRNTHTKRRQRLEPLLHATILMMSSVLFLFPHLWQVSNMICVQQQLLQAPWVAQNILGNVGQRAMSLVHKFHLTIATFEDWNALEHRAGSKLLRALH